MGPKTFVKSGPCYRGIHHDSPHYFSNRACAECMKDRKEAQRRKRFVEPTHAPEPPAQEAPPEPSQRPHAQSAAGMRVYPRPTTEADTESLKHLRELRRTRGFTGGAIPEGWQPIDKSTSGFYALNIIDLCKITNQSPETIFGIMEKWIGQKPERAIHIFDLQTRRPDGWLPYSEVRFDLTASLAICHQHGPNRRQIQRYFEVAPEWWAARDNRPEAQQSEAPEEVEEGEAIPPDAPETEQVRAKPPPNSLVPAEFDIGGRFIKVLTDFDAEDFWWTQAQMAEAFGLTQQAISAHVTNIFGSGELAKDDRAYKVFLLPQTQGSRVVSTPIEHYSFDVFVTIGFKAHATERTKAFREKAREILKNHVSGRQTQQQAHGQDMVTMFAGLTKMVESSQERMMAFVERALAGMAAQRTPAHEASEPETSQGWESGTEPFTNFCRHIPGLTIDRFRQERSAEGALVQNLDGNWVCTPKAIAASPRLLTDRIEVRHSNNRRTVHKYAVLTAKGVKYYSEWYTKSRLI